MRLKIFRTALQLHLVFAAAALVSGFTAVALAAELAPAPLHAFFSAPVMLRAAGQVEIGAVSGVKSALAEAVRAKLSEVKMIPARRGDVAVDASMVVQGRAILTPTAGENYVLSLEGLAIMPPNAMADLITPPRYPAEMFTRDQEGSVELELTVDAAGRVIQTRTVSSSHAAFEKAVRTAVKRWKFTPASDTVRFSVPVVFRMADKRSAPLQPAFDCALPAGQAHIAGQNGCLPLIEVTAQREGG